MFFLLTTICFHIRRPSNACITTNRQLQRDRVRDDADAAHVALHDHVLPAQLALRRRQLDLLPHPQRGHPGQDGAPRHTLPRSGEFGWFEMVLFVTLYNMRCQNILKAL